jgi:hypothetical protein
MMIVPSIGRVVLVFNRHHNAEKAKPEAALVAYVHSDRLINVGGVDHYGMPFAMRSLRLVQEGDAVADDEPHAAWMPYQKAVAKGEIPPTLHATPAAKFDPQDKAAVFEPKV